MNKKNLQDGMIVQLRNGNIHVKHGEMIHGKNGGLILKYYDENLTRKKDTTIPIGAYDIMKVGKCIYNNPFEILEHNHFIDWIWKRGYYQLTQEEYDLLQTFKELGCTKILRTENSEFIYGYNKDDFCIVELNNNFILAGKRKKFNFYCLYTQEKYNIDDILENYIIKENE